MTHIWYILFIFKTYIWNITLTGRLVLCRRALSHSARSASNYIAGPCHDTHLFHSTAFASRKFGHMDACVRFAVENAGALRASQAQHTYFVTLVLVPLPDIPKAHSSMTEAHTAM